MPSRRFPPPWSVEELDACFVVRGQQLSDVHQPRCFALEEEKRAAIGPAAAYPALIQKVASTTSGNVTSSYSSHHHHSHHNHHNHHNL
jgi:hypothetical protein